LIGKNGVVAKRDGVVLRLARDEDLPQVDALTAICYTAIMASYVAMLGEECYQVVRHNPELTWEERKNGQNRRLYEEHPDWLWVLEDDGRVIGFVSFYLFPEQGYGHIDNNGVHPDYAGQGWGTFMYQHVLQHFRDEGLRFAHVDTGLDDAHIPARRAYEAVGFDRQVPTVEYWQDLRARNPGSSRPLGSPTRPQRSAHQEGMPMTLPTRSAKTPVYQLRITLDGITPPIWRVFQLSGDATLYRLHLIIQEVMGWTNSHLFMFTIDGIDYSEPDPDLGDEVRSAHRARLSQVIRHTRQRLRYEYDLGDSWQHSIKVEKVLAPVAGARYPLCLGGERACPPEDCGGLGGYAELLDTIGDPEHEEYEEMVEWLGGEFDPEEFDLGGVNQALRRMR